MEAGIYSCQIQSIVSATDDLYSKKTCFQQIDSIFMEAAMMGNISQNGSVKGVDSDRGLMHDGMFPP